MQELLKNSWCIYVLQCSDGTLYTGITNNLERRLKAHNSGKGAKYTRSRHPCVVVAVCHMQNKSASLKAEHRFKQLSRSQKLVAIEKGIDALFPENLNTDQNNGNADRHDCFGAER